MDRRVRQKKSQVAMEFIVLVGFCFAFALVFLIVISGQRAEISRKRDLVSAQDIAYKIQGEIIIASQVKPGYSRTFYLPEKIREKDYYVVKSSGLISVFFNNLEFNAEIPEAEGEILKGSNTISNTGGVVYLN